MRIIVRYHGRVQGVGFRATVRSIARGHEVTGFVRNEVDGSVYLEAQGDAGAVERFFDDIRGRMGGFIRAEERGSIAEDESESGFEIAR